MPDDTSRPVPLHLRNAPTRLMKDLGYGKGYRYAHDERTATPRARRYFPEGMERRSGTSRPTAASKRRSARSCETRS